MDWFKWDGKASWTNSSRAQRLNRCSPSLFGALARHLLLLRISLHADERATSIWEYGTRKKTIIHDEYIALWKP